MLKITCRCVWCDSEAGIRKNYIEGERVSHGICHKHLAEVQEQARELELPEPGLRNRLEQASS